MKLRNYITAGTLLALLALPVGCTSEDVLDKDPTTPDTEVPGENTRQLLFNFSGLKLKSAATRAETIATKDETVVENLTIILAGVDSETTTTAAAAVIYEYRSNWGGVTPPDGIADPNHQPLTLEQIGNVLVGKLKVDEAVMLPSLLKKRALVLVNGIKVELTDANGAKKVLNSAANMAAENVMNLYAMCGGRINNQSMADLGGSMKLIWGPADLTTENIECPLPMSAEVAKIDFHGSTNLNIQLKRHVARFDLRNGDTDNLRIGSIQPIDANTGIEVAATDARVDMMDQSFLPTDEAVKPDWSNVPNEVVPAFYTHPSALNDATPKQQLMKFKVTVKKIDVDGNWGDERTLTLKLENEDRQPVSINANTRYVITIKAVTDNNITGVIEVVDWNQGGDIDGDLTPTNTKSKKAPTLSGMTDDDVNHIKWTKDAAGVPTTLAFAKLFDNLTMTFTTPKPVAVDPNDPSVVDQPEVSVDIFAAAGEKNAKVWLEVNETAGVAPTDPDTWTLSVIKAVFDEIKPDPTAVVDFPTLYVKVKNHLYPDNSFVMFKVTASDGGKISINTGTAADGTDNPLEIVGGIELGTGGSNDFEMGTTQVTVP